MAIVALVLLFILLLVLCIGGALLFLISRLFKIETSTYKKSLIILALTSVANIIAGIIFVIVNPSLFSVFLTGIVSFFVFNFLCQKNYLSSWGKNLGIYIIFHFFFTIATVVIAPTIIYNVRQYVFSPFIVRGETMSPAYNEGDYVLINKIDRSIDRGDVVVFRSPGGFVGKTPLNPNMFFIKRVIGLPGETIKISSGKVFINGSMLNESYIEDDIPGTVTSTLEGDQYYVLGDNSSASLDSRRLGPISKALIQGKIFYKTARYSQFIQKFLPSK